jgi:hypothetical protein
MQLKKSSMHNYIDNTDIKISSKIYNQLVSISANIKVKETDDTYLYNSVNILSQKGIKYSKTKINLKRKIHFDLQSSYGYFVRILILYFTYMFIFENLHQ